MLTCQRTHVREREAVVAWVAYPERSESNAHHRPRPRATDVTQNRSPPDLDRYRDRVASMIVTDIDQVAAWITDAGGQLIDGPAPGPNGARLIARHPDGSIFEYLQIDEPLPNSI